MSYYADHTSYSFWTQVSENCGGGFIVLPITADAFREFINDVSVPGALDAFDQMYVHGGGAGALPAVVTRASPPGLNLGRCALSSLFFSATSVVDGLTLLSGGEVVDGVIALADATAVGTHAIVNVAAQDASNELVKVGAVEGVKFVAGAPVSITGEYYFSGHMSTGAALHSLIPSVHGFEDRWNAVANDCSQFSNLIL